MKKQKISNLPYYNEGTYKTYIYNKFYDEKILNKVYHPYQINFWKEKRSYGLVDNLGRSIIPKPNRLVGVRGSTGTIIKMFDFVAEAFTEMKAYHETYYRGNKFENNNSIFIRLEPKEISIDVNNNYKNYINDIFSQFTYNFLSLNLDLKITDLTSFMKIFINYMEEFVRNIPLTRSEFLKSAVCPIEVSSLVIAFDDNFNYNDVQIKANRYVSDNNFSAFQESARRYGFFIDKNAPWRMVADLESPVMIEYYNKYGIKNTDDLFQNYYLLAMNSDINTLISVLVGFWNAYTEERSVAINTSEIPNCKNLFAQVYSNKKITSADFVKHFSINWVIRFYLFIRLIESGVKVTQNKFESIYSDAVKINTYVDIVQATQYINSTIIELKNDESVSVSDLTKADEVAIVLNEQAKKLPYGGFSF